MLDTETQLLHLPSAFLLATRRGRGGVMLLCTVRYDRRETSRVIVSVGRMQVRRLIQDH